MCSAVVDCSEGVGAVDLTLYSGAIGEFDIVVAVNHQRGVPTARDDRGSEGGGGGGGEEEEEEEEEEGEEEEEEVYWKG